MGRSSCGTVSLVLAICLGPVVIALLAVSFATDYWIEYTVDRTKLGSFKSDPTKARYTFTRNRGIFRECYPNGTDRKYLLLLLHVYTIFVWIIPRVFPRTYSPCILDFHYVYPTYINIRQYHRLRERSFMG